MTDQTDLSATEMVVALRREDLSAEALLAATMARIEDETPRLNAIVERMDAEARAAARAAGEVVAAEVRPVRATARTS